MGRKGLKKGERAFPKNISEVIRSAIKWIVSNSGFEPVYVAARSIRAVGESTLFANNAILGVIRNFGRWVPICFHIYLYGDRLCFSDRPMDLLLVET